MEFRTNYFKAKFCHFMTTFLIYPFKVEKVLVLLKLNTDQNFLIGKIKISLEEATKQGYEPCKNCRPKNKKQYRRKK